MKKIKIFIIVSVAFLLGAIIATGAVWYYVVVKPLKNAAANLPPVTEIAEEVVELKEKGQAAADEFAGAVAAPTDEELAAVETDPLEEPVVIRLNDLPESQQKMLKTLGIEATEYVVTPSMQVCAEAKIGKERLDAIVAGETPGVLEAASLISCLKE